MSRVHSTLQSDSDAESTRKPLRDSLLVGLDGWNAKDKKGDESGKDGEAVESCREV